MTFYSKNVLNEWYRDFYSFISSTDASGYNQLITYFFGRNISPLAAAGYIFFCISQKERIKELEDMDRKYLQEIESKLEHVAKRASEIEELFHSTSKSTLTPKEQFFVQEIFYRPEYNGCDRDIVELIEQRRKPTESMDLRDDEGPSLS